MHLRYPSRSDTTIVAMLPSDSSVGENRVPDGWDVCVHPQGWIYFYNQSLKLVTDQDIRVHKVAAAFAEHMFQHHTTSEGVELQINIPSEPTDSGLQKPAPFQLAINHEYCIASYQVEDVLEFSNTDPNTLNRRRRLYWNYLWSHPSHVKTPERAIQDAIDALTWFYTDNLISGSKSVVPFSKTECEDLFRVVHQLPLNGDSTSKTVFLAWLLREICSYRAAEHYGLHTQRFHAKKPARSHSRIFLLIIGLLTNIFCFGIPHAYYAHVKFSSEYRGRLASVQQNWEGYVARLVREYSHFLLVVCELPSCFLALPNLSDGAKLATIISTFASLGSIITGVFSIWRHQANTRTSASFAYMHNVEHKSWGLHGHAIVLSLPPVLLVWSIICFTISVVVYAMQNVSNGNPWDRVSAWLILGFFVILLIAVLTALYTFSIIWKFRRRTYRLWTVVQHLWNRDSSASLDPEK
ncbi:hypothetical protein BD779DRAFT_1490637 [Infundibulicybe gibba]|nr:hypothetical protein BD779DRAFT_1490637 [Infundibulicybe gibba]